MDKATRIHRMHCLALENDALPVCDPFHHTRYAIDSIKIFVRAYTCFAEQRSDWHATKCDATALLQFDAP
jgi:hypothetical protein